MELWQEIFCTLLQNEQIKIQFSDKIDIEKLFHDACYQALQKIKRIIEDETLDDPSCFMKVEGIIRTLEALGSNGGFRHDF